MQQIEIRTNRTDNTVRIHDSASGNHEDIRLDLGQLNQDREPILLREQSQIASHVWVKLDSGAESADAS